MDKLLKGQIVMFLSLAVYMVGSSMTRHMAIEEIREIKEYLVTSKSETINACLSDKFTIENTPLPEGVMEIICSHDIYKNGKFLQHGLKGKHNNINWVVIEKDDVITCGKP